VKCPECQFENPADTRFCGNCGTKIIPLDDVPDSHTKTVQIPAKEIERGTTIADRYEVMEELGRGGMGNVYRVVDKKINEEMALKLLHPVIAAEEKTIERFKNELKLARKITHKNVCRMYDLNEEEGTPYITMEYVRGEDLKSMIRMTGQLSVRRALSIAKQICEGLAEAHRIGVLHRDLKPRNIMVDKEGNARIMDFGIARSLKAEGITGDGIMVGTPEYMSPEQVKGEETDERSDIYSLGIILFEMLTGKIPFDGDTSLTIAFKQRTEEPPDPLDFNTQIPEELSTVILKCMEKEKKKRYQNSREVFSELDKIEKEISTEEKIPTKRKTRTVPREKSLRPIWIGGIIFVVVAVLGYVLLTQILPTGEIRWKDSIAVLPIEDRSENKDISPLCEQMTLDIIGKLSIIEDLSVRSYRTVIRYKYADSSNKEIGKLFGVKKILESYMKVEDNKIQLTFHLIDASADSVIKPFEYSGEPSDIIAIQDSLTMDIAKALELPLVGEVFEEYKKSDPKDTKAYFYYVSGKDFAKKYGISYEESDFASAKEMFDEAIKIDPNYAKAFWELGWLHEVRYNKNPDDRDPEDIQSMHEYFRKAYEISPNLAESRMGLGWANFYEDDYDEAFKNFKGALEIAPHDSEINYLTGAFFLSIGLYRQAVKFCARAVELDPLHFWAYHIMAYCSMYVGDYGKADECFQRALDIDPNQTELLARYAYFFILRNDFEEAEKILEKAEKIEEEDYWRIRHARGMLLAIKGEKEKALKLIEDRPYSYFATSVYSLLGMNDEAIENIRAGIEEGSKILNICLYPYPFLMNNPCYDSLRDDSRFAEILKVEKKKHEEKQKKYGKLLTK
jgi:serine/threonine protein kinase/Tfp pilus assembly protein PilF